MTKVQIKLLAEALKKTIPIATEAFWDHHTAGTMPGSGYNHKAEHLAGRTWGWKESKTFQSWHKETTDLLEALETKLGDE